MGHARYPLSRASGWKETQSRRAPRAMTPAMKSRFASALTASIFLPLILSAEESPAQPAKAAEKRIQAASGEEVGIGAVTH